VFVLSAAGWTERSSFRDPDGAADADLGTSVAVDGDSVVVGAPATNANRPDDKGAAYVVSRATTTDSNAQRCMLCSSRHISHGLAGIVAGMTDSVNERHRAPGRFDV